MTFEITTIRTTARRLGNNPDDWPAMDAAPYCPVKTRGLDRIIWKGRQWAVTTYGIERCDGYRYEIAAGRLLENPEYSWVQHMDGKGDFADLPDFAAAFGVAVAYHMHQWGRR